MPLPLPPHTSYATRQHTQPQTRTVVSGLLIYDSLHGQKMRDTRTRKGKWRPSKVEIRASLGVERVESKIRA
ncbi:hypothetical protein FRB93_013502, partial [Tulasnella sp. JGI-2019a]